MHLINHEQRPIIHKYLKKTTLRNIRLFSCSGRYFRNNPYMNASIFIAHPELMIRTNCIKCLLISRHLDLLINKSNNISRIRLLSVSAQVLKVSRGEG